MLEKDTKQYQQPLVQPTIQQQSSITTRSDKISNQVITGPPAAKKEPQKEEDDNTRASKLTKNALAGMKRMKKRKPPSSGTPTKDKDNSSRLAAMKLSIEKADGGCCAEEKRSFGYNKRIEGIRGHGDFPRIIFDFVVVVAFY